MVRMVKAFKTSDGTIFEKLVDAKKHEDAYFKAGEVNESSKEKEKTGAEASR